MPDVVLPSVLNYWKIWRKFAGYPCVDTIQASYTKLNLCNPTDGTVEAIQRTRFHQSDFIYVRKTSMTIANRRPRTASPSTKKRGSRNARTSKPDRRPAIRTPAGANPRPGHEVSLNRRSPGLPPRVQKTIRRPENRTEMRHGRPHSSTALRLRKAGDDRMIRPAGCRRDLLRPSYHGGLSFVALKTHVTINQPCNEMLSVVLCSVRWPRPHGRTSIHVIQRASTSPPKTTPGRASAARATPRTPRRFLRPILFLPPPCKISAPQNLTAWNRNPGRNSR